MNETVLFEHVGWYIRYYGNIEHNWLDNAVDKKKCAACSPRRVTILDNIMKSDLKLIENPRAFRNFVYT